MAHAGAIFRQVRSLASAAATEDKDQGQVEPLAIASHGRRARGDD
jgi:hypothetical protein